LLKIIVPAIKNRLLSWERPASIKAGMSENSIKRKGRYKS